MFSVTSGGWKSEVQVWQDHSPAEGSGENLLLPLSWPLVLLAVRGVPWLVATSLRLCLCGLMVSPCVSAHRLPSVCLSVSTPLLTRTPYVLGWSDPNHLI